MNSVLWILQIFLAVVFAWHGRLYVTWSASAEAWHEKQHPGKPLGLSPALRTFIGICELLAAVGLIAPSLTGILPGLTPLAAVGLTLVMIGAAVFHLSRQEYATVAISVVLVALCVIVAYGRTPSTAQAKMPNPASVHCEQNGGKLELGQVASGGITGVCVFPDGSKCEEWAYFRGECKPGNSPVGPIPTPGPESKLPNPASVFCEQHGNKPEIVTADDGSQKGICIFPDGSTCDEWAYFRGECGPAK
jgi:putative hemolysin